jgi:hypothetical protein
MVWEIGEWVNVRPASTAVDESNPAFRPSPPLTFEVWGYRQARNKVSNQKGASAQAIAAELKSLECELLESMQQAIVDGLAYKHATESYRKFNPEELPFTAVVTPHDAGLHQSDLTLAWKNDRGPTVPTIRRRAKAVQGRPLPQDERRPSPQKQHRKKLAETQKRQTEAAQKEAARRRKRTERQRPAARLRLSTRIDEVMAAMSTMATSVTEEKTSFPFSLDQGNQLRRLVLPKVELDRLVDIRLNYAWTEFDEYDNRVWEYCYALLDPAVKQAKVKRRGTLWGKMNRPQKTFLAFLEFVGQVDNGGVWQFLYNAPEFSFAALETFEEIGATRLAGDYRRTLEELIGKANSISKLRTLSNDERLSSAKRWAAFVSGYKELQTAKRIEKYIFTNRFKASLFKKMSDYIESSLHLLGRISETSAR